MGIFYYSSVFKELNYHQNFHTNISEDTLNFINKINVYSLSIGNTSIDMKYLKKDCYSKEEVKILLEICDLLIVNILCNEHVENHISTLQEQDFNLKGSTTFLIEFIRDLKRLCIGCLKYNSGIITEKY